MVREPGARPSPVVAAGLGEVTLPGEPGRRADACARYATQLGFQFGGEPQMRAALRGLAEPLLADARATRLFADPALTTGGGRLPA